MTKRPMTEGKKDCMIILGKCCMIEDLNWRILKEIERV